MERKMYMDKTCIRVDVDNNFRHTKENPMEKIIGKTVWSVYKNADDNIVVNMNNEAKYLYKSPEGSVFLMEKYGYYRFKEFQILLDSFKIDKVVKVRKGEDLHLDLSAGIKELEKSFSVYTNAGISILNVKNINIDKPYQTQMYRIGFDNDVRWALIDTKNSKYKYRTFYCWTDSPHIVLKDLNRTGIGLPKITS